jgi:hypothetical protein
MSLDEVKRRFVEEIKLRAFDDKYIDRNEEREILQIALQLGTTIDSARAALHQCCETQGYVVESAVMNKIKEIVEQFASNDGKIDEKEFNDAVAICKKACQGKKNDLQCKRMVIDVVEDNSYKVKTGMFSNWYARTKKDVNYGA